jgi:hypothetical protein
MGVRERVQSKLGKVNFVSAETLKLEVNLSFRMLLSN